MAIHKGLDIQSLRTWKCKVREQEPPKFDFHHRLLDWWPAVTASDFAMATQAGGMGVQHRHMLHSGNLLPWEPGA